MKPFNLEEYLKNPSRKVVTRDGRSVRIICTDRKENSYPIIALCTNIFDEGVIEYHKDGRYVNEKESEYDLFFAPEKKEGWVNIYKRRDGEFRLGNLIIYSTKKEAEEYKCNFDNFDYTATIRIEWEE